MFRMLRPRNPKQSPGRQITVSAAWSGGRITPTVWLRLWPKKRTGKHRKTGRGQIRYAARERGRLFFSHTHHSPCSPFNNVQCSTPPLSQLTRAWTSTHTGAAWPPSSSLDVQASPPAIMSSRNGLAVIDVNIDDSNNNIDIDPILLQLSNPSQQACHLTPRRTSASASASPPTCVTDNGGWALSAELSFHAHFSAAGRAHEEAAAPAAREPASGPARTQRRFHTSHRTHAMLVAGFPSVANASLADENKST